MSRTTESRALLPSDAQDVARALRDATSTFWHGGGSSALEQFAPRLLDEPAHSFNFPTYRSLVEAVRAGFPDVTVELEHEVVAAHAAAHGWILRGTHLGEFLGLPATGKRIQARMMSYHWLDGACARRTETTWELGEILDQLGVLASPPPTEVGEDPGSPAPLMPPDAKVPRPPPSSSGWPHEGHRVDHELHPMEDILNRCQDRTWNHRNLDMAFTLVRPAHRLKGAFEKRRRGIDADEYVAVFTALTSAFPDVQLTYVASLGNDEAFAQVTRFSGTHLGPFMGVPATNRPWRITTMAIIPHRDGKMRGAFNFWDQIGLLEQLGAVRLDPFEDRRG